MYNSNSSPTVNDCIFSGNSASAKFNGGGGVYNFGGHPAYVNCIFRHNSSNFSAGGMYNHSCALLVTNCTFYGNSAESWGGGIHNVVSQPTVTSCILWENTPVEIHSMQSTTTVSHSCVLGGFPGTGNIKSDPLFVDPVGGDYHLTFSSPCKDAGDSASVPWGIIRVSDTSALTFSPGKCPPIPGLAPCPILISTTRPALR